MRGLGATMIILNFVYGYSTNMSLYPTLGRINGIECVNTYMYNQAKDRSCAPNLTVEHERERSPADAPATRRVMRTDPTPESGTRSQREIHDVQRQNATPGDDACRSTREGGGVKTRQFDGQLSAERAERYASTAGVPRRACVRQAHDRRMRS